MSVEPAGSVRDDLRAAIPDELSEFFSAGGRSLLIKGATGTGKTTLALTLLRILSGAGSSLYLSTRKAPALLRRDHPWLGALARKGAPSRRGGAPQLELVDARLDEATQLFERITSKLMDSSSPLVVVDTLDALQDFIDTKALKTNVRVLQTWCERAGARLIVTMEDPDSKTIDSLMDGVVVLRQKLEEERRLRQMELLKLYGVNITRPSHVFTLDRGRFRTFSEPRPGDFVISLGAGWPDAALRRMGTGSTFFPTQFAQLDAALAGGIPAGKVTSIDVDEGVDPRIAFLLLGRMIASLAQEGSVVLAPVEGIEQAFVDGYLRLLPETARRRIDRQEVGATPARRPAGQGPVLSVIGSDSGGSSLAGYADLARESGGATVIVRRGEGRGRKRPATNLGAHLRICHIGGAVLVASENPFSQFLGVSVLNEAGAPQLELEPVL